MYTLDDIVPWGRSFDEYQRMFALSERDLGTKILGCADGPASFNAELTRRGGQVISCDPLYRCSADEIRQRIAATFDRVLEEARHNADEFVWDAIQSVEHLAAIRSTAMQAFLGRSSFPWYSVLAGTVWDPPSASHLPFQPAPWGKSLAR